MVRALALLAACGVLAACSGEDPFVETFPADIRKNSALAVCHDQDALPQDILARAAEGCAVVDKAPQYTGTERFQCRLLAPHRAWYKCVDKPKS